MAYYAPGTVGMSSVGVQSITEPMKRSIQAAFCDMASIWTGLSVCRGRAYQFDVAEPASFQVRPSLLQTWTSLLAQWTSLLSTWTSLSLLWTSLLEIWTSLLKAWTSLPKQPKIQTALAQRILLSWRTDLLEYGQVHVLDLSHYLSQRGRAC